MQRSEAGFRVVFRTGRVYELDVARAALSDAGIPSYAQEESFGGVVTAIPSSPTAGPGVWFNVLVPEERLADARRALSSASIALDLDEDPGIWHFDPSRRGRLQWKALAIFCLLIAVVIAVATLLELF